MYSLSPNSLTSDGANNSQQTDK